MQGSPNYGPRGHFVRPTSRLPVAKTDQSLARCTRGICPNPPKINQYLINTQLHMCTYRIYRPISRSHFSALKSSFSTLSPNKPKAYFARLMKTSEKGDTCVHALVHVRFWAVT